ncbi:OmpA family protein [Pedobacter sp. SYSU D00535]|uniref:OmpA family protein n=1 Tax=Pedobacter sp. SYSU D00535 TaxID=2810308 RepID=UPI001A961D0F|nr:OmpA family protein [Pedobacter sp. SYSU D00535]
MKNVLLLFLCCWSAFSYSQPTVSSSNKQAQKFYDLAKQAPSKEKEIEFLQSAVQADPSFIAAIRRLGDLNRSSGRHQEAIGFYEKVLSLNPEFDRGTYLGIGTSKLAIGEYTSALAHLTKYLSYPNVPEANKLGAQKLIADCRFALDAIKRPQPFNPINLGSGVNTAEMEYLPVVTADQGLLIFTRRVGDKNEDFFKSENKDGQWTTASGLSPAINTPSYNEGAQTISPDGNYLFFTGCNRPDGKGSCDIYISRREGKDWSAPFNLGSPINGRGWESQPAISANGSTLYFVSNRPGGLGGYDIWKTELQSDGGWSAPENLGPSINTAYDENFPFIHPDNETLYFSSNGWPGMGDKDLFVSRKDASGNWAKAENLGYPINTFAEESSLTISSDGRTAYYASNREGGLGGLDLHSFELPVYSRPKSVTYIKGIVLDEKTKECLIANVKITELSSRHTAFDDQSNEDGQFLSTLPVGKSYAFTVEKEGYLLYSQNFPLNRSSSSAQPFTIEVPLQKIEVGKLATLSNIFFETNKADLLPESEVELQQLIHFMNANPKVSIEIAGHTDNVGEEKTNQVLSENRARRVYGYLVNNRIAPQRLSFKGYGESKPLLSNTTEEGRQKNRRTEFKILSY